MLIACAIVVVVGALAFGGYLLFASPDERTPSEPDIPIPPTTFAFDRVEIETTIAGKQSGGSNVAARRAAHRVEFVMNTLYTVAFADETHWGNYDDAWALFEKGAATRAQDDVEVLTLGDAAHELYTAIAPDQGRSRVAITVLIDARRRPLSIIAETVFAAEAELSDGGATSIRSAGVFFLRRSGDAWRIYAYRSDRHEEAIGAPPSAEPSG